MKVQCDVCAAEAASVFCCADEAALCDACDRRVHRANKLAGKHRRFSLLNPSSASSLPPPLCDICQERRGFLFCKEDRAILCRECDAAVHAATELTMRHARFLLTGVRVSSEPAAPPAPPPCPEEENAGSFCCSGDDDDGSSSSISEYLTKTLPGWHVEDFLVDEATAAAAADAATSAHRIVSGRQPERRWAAPSRLPSCVVGAGALCTADVRRPRRRQEIPGVHRLSAVVKINCHRDHVMSVLCFGSDGAT